MATVTQPSVITAMMSQQPPTSKQDSLPAKTLPFVKGSDND